MSAKDKHDVDEAPVLGTRDRHRLDGDSLGSDRPEDADQEGGVIVPEHR